MKFFSKSFIALVSFILLSSSTFAYSGDISVNSDQISFSKGNFLEGNPVRIYATIENHSNLDLLGIVRFFDNDKEIGSDQAVSIFKGATDGVFIDWIPNYGNHKIAVKIYPWIPEIDDPSNNWMSTEIFVIQDTDHDGIPNKTDDDDDNDQVKDSEDDFPLNPKEQYDTDGDGKGNNNDTDDDNDGVPDEYDDLPLDPNETTDTDKDGIGDVSDNDDDNDGLSDSEEENLKTNPLKVDTDDDDTDDSEDDFPLNPSEWTDTDGDKIGNNTDTDDDNDGLSDENDPYPLNKAPVVELKNDNPTIGLLSSYTFDASPSYDGDGEIVSFNWKIDGKIQKEGNAINHTFNKTGEHKINLSITDNYGETTTSDFTVSVVNTRLYIQLGIILITILLALTIFFQYISEAKNSKANK